MDFPITDLLSAQGCYDWLVGLLHPAGLACPHGHSLEDCYVHKRHRAPLLGYRCKICKCCFNALTGTVLMRTHYSAAEIVLLVRGIAQGVSTAQLARELGRDRGQVLAWRHKLQEQA